MSEYSAGSAYIQLLPSLKNFKKDTDAQLKGYNPRIEVALIPRVDQAALPEADRQGSQGGKAYSDAFERTVQSRISAALKALPAVDVTVDSTDAERKIADIRAELEDLSTKHIGVDIGADAALAKVEDLRAQLDDLAKHDGSIQVRVDAADASAKLAEVDAEIRKLDSTTAKVNVEFDVDQASLARAKADAAAVSSASAGAGGGLGTAGLITGAIAAGAGPLAGGALALIPVAVAAIGVLAEKSDAQVQTSFSGMATAAKKSLTEGFQPFVPVLVNIANQTKSAVTAMEPEFQQAATAAAPLLQTLSTGLLHATQDGVSGTVTLLRSVQPETQALANGFGQLEHGVIGFFQNLDGAQASRGLVILFTDIEQMLPAVGNLFSAVMPLGNALLQVVGPAFVSTANAAAGAKPVIQAVSSVITFLGPAIGGVTPYAVAAIVVTKLMTGSWLDFGGAISKVKPLFTDTSNVIGTLASKLGITTAATKDAAVADATSTLAKAKLVAAADAQSVSELQAGGAAAGSAQEQLKLAEAQAVATASAEAEAAAQASLDEAAAVSTFAMGPLGIALGAVAGVLALVGLNTSKATAPTTDLTSELVKLGQAAPGATQGIINGDPALTTLINQASQAGVSVKGLLAAYAGGPQALQSFSDALSHQHDVLGSTTVGLRQAGNGYAEASGNAAQTFTSIKDLTDQVNNHGVALADLSPRLRNLVNAYNAQNDVQGQLGTSVQTLTQRQQANNSVTGQGASASAVWTQAVREANVATQAQAEGLSTSGTDMVRFAALTGAATLDVEAFQKAQVAAAAGNLQADQTFQQLGQAVVQAQQQYDQSAASVDSARRSEQQAAQAVVTAQEGVRTAVLGVATAEQNAATAQRASLTATQNLTAARAAAVAQLKQLSQQVTDQADTEDEAKVRLLQAQDAVKAAGLQNTTLGSLGGPTDGNLANYQLLLALQEAQHNFNNTMSAGVDLRQQQAQADALGVDGNAQVVAAQNQVIQAQQQQQAASQALITANQAVAKAAQGVQDAEYSQGQAHKATALAVQAEGAASTALTTAKSLNSTSTDINTVAGNRNVTMLLGLYDNQIAAGKSTADASAAVEIEAGKLGFAKTAVDNLIGSIQAVPPTTPFAVVGQPTLDITQLMQQAQSQGINLNTLGLPPSQVSAFQNPVNPRAVPQPKAFGGPIEGSSPTPTADNIPVLATAGEWMHPVASVDYYGPALMAAIQHRAIPRDALTGLATGGPVTANMLWPINYRLAAWESMLGATGATMTALGAKGVPTLPAPAASVSLGAFGSLGGGAGGPTPNIAGYTPGGSVAQWLPQIQQALSLLGLAASWAPTVERRMDQESGGNPTIVNKWDSNWTAGTPSVGLMQVIGPTFAHNAGPFAATGPFEYGVSVDPLANIYAGLHYADARYGSLSALDRPGGYDSGGWLPPGLQTVYNGTKKPEAILTNDQWSAIADRTSGSDGGQFTGTLMLDSGEFLGKVRGEILKADHLTGGAITTRTR